MISLAMTTYNGSKYIKEQLDSIKNQTLKIDEVVIVDDCSTDDTVFIIKKFIKDNKLLTWSLFENEKNQGYIYTFRKSIDKTNGDYIFLCDQDDVWEFNKVEDMMEVLEKNLQIKSLSCSFSKIDQKGHFLKNCKKRPFSSNNNLIRKSIKANSVENITLAKVITYNISPGCTCAFKREIKKDFLNNELQIPHDWAINFISASVDGLYFFNKKLIKYRLHSSNTIGLTRSLDRIDRLRICKSGLKERMEMRKFLEKNNFSLNYIDKIIKVFEKREEALHKKSIIKCLRNILLSLHMNGLIDTTFVDLLSVLKREK